LSKIILKLKIFLEWFVEWFVFIATGILMICAINFALFSDGEQIPRATLIQILFSAMLTAAVTAVFFMLEPLKKSSMIFCFILHFSSLTAIMVVCGLHFGWVESGLIEIVKMGASVAFVYVFVIIIYYILDIRRAEQINRRLKEKYKDEEEL